MIHVDLDKILTAKALQEHLSTILFDVEDKEELYVITKKGRPRAALINIDYLQELTGKDLGEGQEYDQYPTQAGVPQGTTDLPPITEETTITPVISETPITSMGTPTTVPEEKPVTPEEPALYPDLDIDSLEIPEEESLEPETAEVVMPVPPVTPATPLVPAQPVAPAQTPTTPPAPNLGQWPDQAPPPAAPTPSQ